MLSSSCERIGPSRISFSRTSAYNLYMISQGNWIPTTAGKYDPLVIKSPVSLRTMTVDLESRRYLSFPIMDRYRTQLERPRCTPGIFRASTLTTVRVHKSKRGLSFFLLDYTQIMLPLETLQDLQRIQTDTYIHASGITIVIFDWLLTFHKEHELIWGAPWNLGKFLYILTRYSAFFDTTLSQYHELKPHLSARTCSVLHTLTGWLELFGIVVAEVILSVRVWALWERRRVMAITMSIFALVCIAASAISFLIFHRNQTFTALDTVAPGYRLSGCYATGGNNFLYMDFVMLMVYETALVVLTFIKGIQHFRQGTSSLSYTFFRDGLMYYIILLAVSVVNVVILFVEQRQFSNLLTSFQRVIHSVFSARIILNLREKNRQSGVVSTEDDALMHQGETPVTFRPTSLVISDRQVPSA
ncbi:hypothetical protein C8J56DRAFT_243941 [Mycena floridula]|nr:hypothetical protein C8J56DRAFT_243941 [Mycena floridula]